MYVSACFVALNCIAHSFLVRRNNLYGTAMCESLPEKEFDFLLDEQAAAFDFMSVPDDGPEGYILEVDLEYPEELHGAHSDYPLCPESAVIEPNDLSPYTVSLAEKLGVKPSGCRKLLGTLKGKERYALHYRNLKLYVRLGMRVKKIHRVISFTQSRWLKPYIDFNTDQRKKAANEFEKDFFKLMNNSVFGKTMVSNLQASKLGFVKFVFFPSDCMRNSVVMSHTRLRVFFVVVVSSFRKTSENIKTSSSSRTAGSSSDSPPSRTSRRSELLTKI